jgi:hypothetical protein
LEYFISTAYNLLAATIVAGFVLLVIGVFSSYRLVSLVRRTETAIKCQWRSKINVPSATRTTRTVVERLVVAASADNPDAAKDDETAPVDDGTFVNDAGDEELSRKGVRVRPGPRTPHDTEDNGSGNSNRHRRSRKKKRRNKQHQSELVEDGLCGAEVARSRSDGNDDGRASVGNATADPTGLDSPYDDGDCGCDDDDYCEEGLSRCQVAIRQVLSSLEDQNDYGANGDTFPAAAASSGVLSTGQSTAVSSLDDSRAQLDIDYMWSLADDDYCTEDRFWPENATPTKSNTSLSGRDERNVGFEFVNSVVDSDDCSLDNGNEADEADKSDEEIDPAGRRNCEKLSMTEKSNSPADSAKSVNGPEESQRGQATTSTVDDRSLMDEITFRLKRLVWLVDSVTADRHMFDRLPPLVAGTLQIITKEVDALSSAWSAFRNQSASSAPPNQQFRYLQRAGDRMSINKPESNELHGVMGPQPAPVIAADAPSTLDDSDNSWMTLTRPSRHRRPHRPRHRRNAYGLWMTADEPLTEIIGETGSADDNF